MSAEPSLTPSPAHTQAGDVPTDAAAPFPQSFGPYLLIHRIGRGGMGDVFLGKTGGVMGIEKHCVVKTLRNRYTDDPEYVERFVEEARLVVQLTHRNICPVFDVGRVGNGYYLAMELVIGRNVRAVLEDLANGNVALPPAAAVHIAAELLDALDYAHRHVDPTTGQPLHLVHRDVSPQNVLVNFEGEVKLIDFGLAETGRETTAEHSSTGSQSVMGKMAYMAPEQARAEIVDPRADQFAAAVVTYEMLAGERYYAGLTSHEVWQRAGIGDHRPASFARLDREIAAVLDKALAGDKEARFRSCGEFRDALLEVARKKALPAGGPMLRKLMNDHFAPDLDATRELIRRFAHVRVRPQTQQPSFQQQEQPVTVVGPAMRDATITSDVFSIATSVHAQAIHDPTELIRAAPTAADVRRTTRSINLAAAAAAVAALAAVVVAAVVALREPRVQVVSTPPPPAAPELPIAALPPPTPPAPAPTPPAAAAPPDTAEAAPARRVPARRKVARESRPPATLNVGDKMAVVKRCADPCKAPLVPWDGKLGDHPDVTAFKKQLDACYARCAVK